MSFDDPLSAVTLADPPSDTPSDTPSTTTVSTETPTTPPSVPPKRSKTPLILGGVGIFVVLIVAMIVMFSGRDDQARSKNETIPALTAQLGVERDYEWGADQVGHDEAWKKSYAWLNTAKATLSEAALRTEIDPWRSERWEIEYRAGHTLESYVRELDSLGIELGLLGMSANGAPGDPIYVSDLTNAIPKTRSGKIADERRYYMLWRIGSLKSADGKLLTTAKLDPKGKYVAHFYPASVEQDMVAREVAFADGRPIADIRKTIFSIRPQGANFSMTVIRQEYHDGSVKELAGDDGSANRPKSRLTPPTSPPPATVPPVEPTPAVVPAPAASAARVSTIASNFDGAAIRL
ncbi:MAG: hypothetical protein QM811_15180 [Pirellulales bacterium]